MRLVRNGAAVRVAGGIGFSGRRPSLRVQRGSSPRADGFDSRQRTVQNPELKGEHVKDWQVADRLGAYENTGLTPEQIMELKERMNDGWIPADEVLPEDDVEVLVTYADIDDEQYTGVAITTYGYAYLGGNKLDFKEWRNPFSYFRSNYKVIAWRPLPEPYCPKKESEGSRRLREREEFFKE